MSEKKNISKKELRRRKRKRALMIKTGILCVLLVIFGIGIWALAGGTEKIQQKAQKKEDQKTAEVDGSVSSDSTGSAEAPTTKAQIMAEADALAQTYDYDGAIEKLQSVEGAATDADIITKVAEYTSTRDACVRVNVNEVTHIFYHSLVVDPQKAFYQDNAQTAGFCQWMTTVDEFNAITQQMYDRGYVMVSINDLVKKTVDDDGTVHYEEGDIYLPEGKKAFVLSLDDLSYYHSYDGRGIASKMVVGDDGKPTCEYIQDDGTVVTGAYDCIPLMDQFIEAHPDAVYHNARGTVALTGYDGILGYRTDGDYKTREDLTDDQVAWLDAHPDFDWDKECEEAKKVADAIKADGWTFASHTWGHIRVGDKPIETIQADTEKWLTYVAPLIGGSDIIIFAHGQDLSDWHDYTMDNEKFAYLKSQGFNISEIHRTEPYVYSQMIAGKDAKTFGEAKNSWLTGTAAWTFLNVSQFILGVEPTLKGLSVNPCIPKNFGNFTITRTFRGVEYNIEVKNPNNVEKGVKELIVDGQSLGQTTVIPYDASKKQVFVTVQMG